MKISQVTFALVSALSFAGIGCTEKSADQKPCDQGGTTIVVPPVQQPPATTPPSTPSASDDAGAPGAPLTDAGMPDANDAGNTADSGSDASDSGPAQKFGCLAPQRLDRDVAYPDSYGAYIGGGVNGFIAATSPSTDNEAYGILVQTFDDQGRSRGAAGLLPGSATSNPNPIFALATLSQGYLIHGQGAPGANGSVWHTWHLDQQGGVVSNVAQEVHYWPVGDTLYATGVWGEQQSDGTMISVFAYKKLQTTDLAERTDWSTYTQIRTPQGELVSDGAVTVTASGTIASLGLSFTQDSNLYGTTKLVLRLVDGQSSRLVTVDQTHDQRTYGVDAVIALGDDLLLSWWDFTLTPQLHKVTRINANGQVGLTYVLPYYTHQIHKFDDKTVVASRATWLMPDVDAVDLDIYDANRMERQRTVRVATPKYLSYVPSIAVSGRSIALTWADRDVPNLPAPSTARVAFYTCD